MPRQDFDCTTRRAAARAGVVDPACRGDPDPEEEHEEEPGEDHGDLDADVGDDDAAGNAEAASDASLSDIEEVGPIVEGDLAEPPVVAGGGEAVAGGLHVVAGPGHLASHAEVVVTVGSGDIVYYPATKRFMANCYCPDHGRCNRTRKADEGKRPSVGRPLGLLAAWLGDAQNYDTKASHTEVGIHQSLADRQAARAALQGRATAGDEGVALLLSRERPRRLDRDEPDEPVIAP